MNNNFKGPSGRTRKYYWWRLHEYFGIPYPKDDPRDTVYHDSMVMAFEQLRKTERGVTAYAIAEAGTMNPQLLVQFTPLYWGIDMSMGDGYVSSRIGPIAIKIYYGPMLWKTNIKKEVDNL